MTKTIALIVATTGALLMVACTPESQSVESGGAEDPSDIDWVDGSRISLGESGKKWTVWASINAAHDKGVSVENVRAGDKLTIEAISGVGYFAGRKGWWRVLSVIYNVSGVFAPTGSAAANALTELSDATLPGDGLEEDSPNSKPRDGYGRKLGDGGAFAEKEGGIVVCMPSARGPVYAHTKNHFSIDGGQRKWKAVSEMKDQCFAATRTMEEKSAEEDGVLYIYAFDKNYRDNAGTYEVKFRIERP